MKIACYSDIHGTAIRPPKEGVNLTIFAGDITYLGKKRLPKRGKWNEADDFNPGDNDLDDDYGLFQKFLKKLQGNGVSTGTKVFVAGNHDFWFQDQKPEAQKWANGLQNTLYLEDSSALVNDHYVYGSPWTPNLNMAFGMQTPEECRRIWDQIPDNVDILITHTPPYGILDEDKYGNKFGDWHLLEAVKRIKPKLHVFGHIHHCGGQTVKIGETLFVNAAVVDDNYQLVRPQGIVVDI